MGRVASVAPTDTCLVGVRIKESSGLKRYGAGQNPIPRGNRVPAIRPFGVFVDTRLRALPQYLSGREAANALRVDVLRGEAPLNTVLQDVLNLTKLNFNACIYGDGLPVTLRFADAVGEILTAGPVQKISRHCPSSITFESS